MRSEEAGALHRLGLDQGRRDDRDEAVRAGLLHGQVDQRELELGADAGQEVEAGATDLGTANAVDGLEIVADLGVVARAGDHRGRAYVLEHDEVVLTAGRCPLDDVRDRQMGGAQGRLGFGLG